ncbi:hypothetical protein CSV71_07760 [Sporosarcina sp. P21c]|uniref:hypothetical protein n=1 Tax=unclassified Sporosarcina TaxID=2647733 RepID=UPI000C17114C|nr:MULTISPECIES: hypothetical protein [unclassified Sporosarcina]PIC66700.1 hypothetical protein CSV78_10980 [Sporosarcina sp. P16a]PIC83454.1 hypothetical protein CSV73_07795 [Sporosarcina sp. P1]PIC89835.1 hypothetical protein CSV71_07760 [Sporosarcina sp. P21c]PIC93221.1 hypothetical protein CSV70_06575 [Sporosarcina sp. P25]
MKIRGVILALLVAGGFYVMIQTIDEAASHPFERLQEQQLNGLSPYSFITFRQPGLQNEQAVTWKVDQVEEVDRLLQFLQAYDYERVDPDTLELFDDQPLFTIDLHDESGNRMTVLVEEGVLIHNDRLYYEVVNGPLQVDWLMEFILSNKP